MSCCSRNSPERLRRRREKRRPGRSSRRCRLDRAHQERDPRDEQQHDERPRRRACVRMPAFAMTSQAPPARPCRRRSGDSPDRESASLLAPQSRPRGRTRPRASARSAGGDAPARRSAAASANSSRAPPSPGTNTRIDVLVGGVALEARPRAAGRRTSRDRRALDAQLEHPAARLLQRRDRSRRRDPPLVHHDDVIAGVLDVGQQMRREDEVDALVVRRDRGRARASRRGPSDPCRWSARRETADRDRAPAPAPA